MNLKVENLRIKTAELVREEKRYTALILKNLAVIERRKLFSEYGHPSLFKYLTKELKYSDSEANTRVAAVRLVVRDASVAAKVAKGQMSLTNAAEAQTSLKQYERENKAPAKPHLVKEVVGLALETPTREAKEKLRKKLKLKRPRTEKLTLDARILEKVDRARKIYGNVSAYELLDILLEEKLKTPSAPLRNLNTTPKNSRYIPVAVKHSVHGGKCQNCGERRNLHYDHIKGYARGGDNSAANIQVLCENCNRRKYLAGK